jgi:S1-C subfamily serine protease
MRATIVVRNGHSPRLASALLITLTLLIVLNRAFAAESVTSELLAAVVKVRTEIPHGARSAELLGPSREGSGVVIEEDGLILTIGYVILEAAKIEVSTAEGKVVNATLVGVDYDAGFGLLRTSEPLGVKPMPLGRSSELKVRERVLVVGEGKPEAVHPAFVTSRREFAGYWEYLLEDAIFTAPPYARFAGAALVDTQGQLLGIGSLFVRDALPDDRAFPGNMFVPIDRLKSVLADILAKGRPATPPRPWLGIYTEEHWGRLFVAAVAPGGPAEKAGLKPGDLIVGIAGKTVNSQADLYRAMWAQGSAGAEITLNLVQGVEIRNLVIRSGDRSRYFDSQSPHAVPRNAQSADGRDTPAGRLYAFSPVYSFLAPQECK